METGSDDFYVYILAYPENMGGSVFYVGKGKGQRIYVHEAEAKKGTESAKCAIIRKIWEDGGKVEKKKVAEHLSCPEALHLEQELIITHGLSTLSNQRSEGRSLQLQVLVTKELKQWIKEQMKPGENVSLAVYRLLEGIRNK